MRGPPAWGPSLALTEGHNGNGRGQGRSQPPVPAKPRLWPRRGESGRQERAVQPSEAPWGFGARELAMATVPP